MRYFAPFVASDDRRGTSRMRDALTQPRRPPPLGYPVALLPSVFVSAPATCADSPSASAIASPRCTCCPAANSSLTAEDVGAMEGRTEGRNRQAASGSSLAAIRSARISRQPGPRDRPVLQQGAARQSRTPATQDAGRHEGHGPAAESCRRRATGAPGWRHRLEPAPPLAVFAVLQRSFIQGLTVGALRD
jgi:hypothetical protein